MFRLKTSVPKVTGCSHAECLQIKSATVSVGGGVFLFMLLSEDQYLAQKVRTFLACNDIFVDLHNFKRVFEGQDLVLGDWVQLRFSVGLVIYF